MAWDPNAIYVHHLVEFLRGETAVDSSCTNGDLLCFALHMIMIDSGYQPNVSRSVAWAECLILPHPLLRCRLLLLSHSPPTPSLSLAHSRTHYLSVTLAVLFSVAHVPIQLLMYQLQ